MEQGEGEREDAGPRPEDEPGSGVVTAFGRPLKLLRVRAGLDRPEFGKLTGYAAPSIACRETAGEEMSNQMPEPTAPEPAWSKSSYSSGEGGECVEVADAPGAVCIRDIKISSGPVLTVTPQAWAGLVRLAADRPA
ncbi:DUF397 domain-containing protein [Streptomyces sp. NPDC054804]